MTLRYREVKSQIKELLEGMSVHTKVPSRQWLSKKFGVARSTVDKAITELVDEEFLYCIKGSGTYIQERSDLKKIINIGIILPSMLEACYTTLLNGVQKYSAHKDINIIICGSENMPQKQHDYVLRLLESKVDGCIIIPSINTEKNYLSFSMLKQHKVPFVFCNRFVEGIDVPFFGNNNYYGSYMATKHLIDQGCKRIAYMSPNRYVTSIERYYGYMTAMLDSNIIVHQQDIIHSNVSIDILKNQIRTIFSQNTYPDGVICFNDVMASYLYEILIEKNIVIGQEVKVVGYDDSLICETLPVKLSSVSAQSEEVGVEAMDLLMKMIKGEVALNKDNICLFTPQLKVRASSLQ